MTATRGRTRLLWLGAGLVVLLGVTTAYLVTRPPAQAQVGGDALPTVATAHQAAVYVDCSTLNSITYDPHNPCQTFVLLQSRQFANAKELLRAEGRLLVDSGWRHSARQPVDYDSVGNAMASPSDSWAAGDRHVCAYVETAEAGVAAERRELFPYDPYNQPQGVLEFYRKARAAKQRATLWIRLRPPNRGGRCIG